MTAAHYLHLLRVGPSLDRLLDSVHTVPARGQPALRNSRSQFLVEDGLSCVGSGFF